MMAATLKAVGGVFISLQLLSPTLFSVRFWRFRFVEEIVSRLGEILSMARPINYDEVLELDALIRVFKAHNLLQCNEYNHHFLSSEGRKALHPFVSATMIHLSEYMQIMSAISYATVCSFTSPPRCLFQAFHRRNWWLS